jgi:uncharacterized protein
MRNPHNDPLTGPDKGKPRDTAPRRATVRDAASRKRASGTDSDSAERKCILSGAHDARDDLIRLALSPDGAVLPDVLARAPGRGAWIGVTRAELDQAVAKGKLKGALARAFKGAPLTISADLGERIETALRRALSDRLGVELRAGAMILGTEKIATACRGGQVRFLGHAADARDDGAAKLAQAWRVGEDAEGSGMKGTILPLDRAALSVALGRDNVVHLALTNASAAARVAGLLGRLTHFLGRQPTDAAPADHTAGNDAIDTKGE